MPESASSPDLVTREVRDGVGIISLNRPEVHNAVTEPLRAQLRQAFAWAAAETEVRAVLVRGNGRSFCSGRDTSQFGVRPPGVTHLDAVGNAQAVRMEQIRITKPTVAAVQGATMGAGAELAMAMDIRVAADTLKFSLPEVNYGLVVDTGASRMAVELAGLSRAKWLIMSGEAIGAGDALAWGLVDWVVGAGELEAKAFEVARTLASKPPRAVAMAKRLINDALEARLAPAMTQELLAQCVLFEGEEFKRLRDERKARRGK
ncbi:MAG TPA: enoyl-CoA hydratase/isomerase family protein [Burkholderiales bacterium]|nr:enoyl-CoA hydratase/isomerase family protein [Burkholderiales bacterium]